MTGFEKVLQECLHDLEQGASNVEGCLRRYPQYAHDLEPILLTTTYLERAREMNISDPFRARVRTRLIKEMRARPRRRARSGFLFVPRTALLVRLAAGFAAIVLALLATGTVYAQNALPGELFYPWKLTSENVWRAVSPDPIGTDLAIADRRVDEMIAVSDDPVLYAQALNAYLAASDRLKSEVNPENETRILPALDSQAQELKQSGIVLPQLEQEVPPSFEEPTSIAPSALSATPLPVLDTPQIEPTDLPQIVPTMQAPSEPTVEVPPVDIPTVDVPPVEVPTIEDPTQIVPKIVPTIEIPPLP